MVSIVCKTFISILNLNNKDFLTLPYLEQNKNLSKKLQPTKVERFLT